MFTGHIVSLFLFCERLRAVYIKNMSYGLGANDGFIFHAVRFCTVILMCTLAKREQWRDTACILMCVLRQA
uniref:Secreted protein n=1 Tax=Anguilla anguilla TaxID=7936 RepID=A0A0E9XMK9_ANGAN